MRPDWLAEEERARDRAAANALFAGQGFTGVAQSPNRPDQLSQPDSSAFSTVSSSIGTSDTFLSTRQIGSGRILDIDFDMLNSGIEAREPVAKAGFSNTTDELCSSNFGAEDTRFSIPNFGRSVLGWLVIHSMSLRMQKK